MKLVSNWKDGWKWLSTNCMALAAATVYSWDMIPPEWKLYLPVDHMPTIVLVLLGIGIVGRFVDMSPVPKE